MNEDSKALVTPPAMPTFRPEMAFPSLTEEMVERLHGYGRVETLEPETALFARGEREVDMFVVLEGTLEIYSQDEKNERKLLAAIGEKQFTGELDLLQCTRRTLVDGATLTRCVLLRIPRAQLRRLMRSEGDIANLIMQATIWRRLGIIELSSSSIVLLWKRRVRLRQLACNDFSLVMPILIGCWNLPRSKSSTRTRKPFPG